MWWDFFFFSFLSLSFILVSLKWCFLILRILSLPGPWGEGPVLDQGKSWQVDRLPGAAQAKGLCVLVAFFSSLIQFLHLTEKKLREGALLALGHTGIRQQALQPRSALGIRRHILPTNFDLCIKIWFILLILNIQLGALLCLLMIP